MFAENESLSGFAPPEDQYWRNIRVLMESKYDLANAILSILSDNDTLLIECVNAYQRFLAEPRSVSVLIDCEWMTQMMLEWLRQEQLHLIVEESVDKLIRVQAQLDHEIEALSQCIDDRNAGLMSSFNGAGAGVTVSPREERARRGLELPPVLISA